MIRSFGPDVIVIGGDLRGDTVQSVRQRTVTRLILAGVNGPLKERRTAFRPGHGVCSEYWCRQARILRRNRNFMTRFTRSGAVLQVYCTGSRGRVPDHSLPVASLVEPGRPNLYTGLPDCRSCAQTTHVRSPRAHAASEDTRHRKGICR